MGRRVTGTGRRENHGRGMGDGEWGMRERGKRKTGDTRLSDHPRHVENEKHLVLFFFFATQSKFT